MNLLPLILGTLIRKVIIIRGITLYCYGHSIIQTRAMLYVLQWVIVFLGFQHKVLRIQNFDYIFMYQTHYNIFHVLNILLNLQSLVMLEVYISSLK